MTESTSTHDDERDEKSDQSGRSKVATRIHSPKVLSEACRKPNMIQVATKDLEACIGRQRLGRETQREISIDTSPQNRFSSPHWVWPFGLGGGCVATSTNHAERPVFKRKGGASKKVPPFLLQISVTSGLDLVGDGNRFGCLVAADEHAQGKFNVIVGWAGGAPAR
jgi:hypothetical protein